MVNSPLNSKETGWQKNTKSTTAFLAPWFHPGRRRILLGMLTWWRRPFCCEPCDFPPFWNDNGPGCVENGVAPRSWASTLDPAPSTRTADTFQVSKKVSFLCYKMSPPKMLFLKGLLDRHSFQSFGLFFSLFPDIHRSELTWHGELCRTGWSPGIAHRSFPVFVCSPGTQGLSPAILSHSLFLFCVFFLEWCHSTILASGRWVSIFLMILMIYAVKCI